MSHFAAALLSALRRWAEPAFVLIAAPLMLFQEGTLAWIGLCILAIGWLIGTWASSAPLRSTALRQPLLVIFLMTLLGVYISIDRGLSMPKFFGILVGIGTFFATVRSIKTPRQLLLASCLMLPAILIVAGAGLVATDWQGKFALMENVHELFPRMLETIQTSSGARPGIHPNELGGTLAFLLPLPGALLLVSQSARSKLVYLMTGAIGLAVLVISESRSAAAAVAVAVLLLLLWRRRRLGLSIVACLAAVVSALLLFRGNQLDAIVQGILADTLVQSRFELWQRSLQMTQDYLFTGIGLNTFPLVIAGLYPIPGSLAPTTPHAHNIFLQTTLDMGLAGLLSLLGIGGFAIAGYARILRAKMAAPFQDIAIEATAIGVYLGIIVYLISGLIDAIGLGAKPAFLLWYVIGLAVACERFLPSKRPGSLSSDERSEDDLRTRVGSISFIAGICRLVTGAILRPVRRGYWVVVYVAAGIGYLIVALAAITDR